jgi:DNA-binding LacI/PurR family transcriptional regulator
MQRREFITLLGSAAATWPLAARAQQAEPMRRIGVLMNVAEDDAEGQARLAAFAQALKQLGWSDGRNLRMDTRWATAEDIRKHAAELTAVALPPGCTCPLSGVKPTSLFAAHMSAYDPKRTSPRPLPEYTW